jgi:putative acetyltransferase
MEHRIDYIDKFEYNKVVEVWEASVRATHHFLIEEDIAYFKPLILNTYLDAVELRCFRDEHFKILGFIGVSDGNLQMLFIHPTHIGKRIGKTLLEYAINSLNVNKVDVN